MPPACPLHPRWQSRPQPSCPRVRLRGAQSGRRGRRAGAPTRQPAVSSSEDRRRFVISGDLDVQGLGLLSTREYLLGQLGRQDPYPPETDRRCRNGHISLEFKLTQAARQLLLKILDLAPP